MACTDLQAVAPSPHSALCMPEDVPKALICTAFRLESPLLQMSETSNTHELSVQAPDVSMTAIKSEIAAADDVFIAFTGN